MNKTVTIVLLISRQEYLHQVFAYLELMDCDNDNTNLIAIVDGDDRLFIDARNKVELSKFASRLCVKYVSDDKLVPNVIHARRLRIASIHNQLKTYIGKCDYIFGIEDDTLVPKYALKNLLNDYTLNPYAGFIEGVELGRWGVYYVGAWKFDDIYKTTKVTSMMPSGDSPLLQEIDAGGFYCFMTRRDTYINHEFDTFENNTFGPDVNFGASLRKQGYMNYIDWSIDCIHRNKDKSISYPKMKPEKIEFVKKQNIWSYSVK